MLINEGLRVADRGDVARLSMPLPVMHRHGLMHPALAPADVSAYRHLLAQWASARRRLGVTP